MSCKSKNFAKDGRLRPLPPSPRFSQVFILKGLRWPLSVSIDSTVVSSWMAEMWKWREGCTPVVLGRSAQAVGNTRDDLPRTARERGKSVEVKEKRGVKICRECAVCAKRAVGLVVEGRSVRDLEGIRPLPFPSAMLQELI